MPDREPISDRAALVRRLHVLIPVVLLIVIGRDSSRVPEPPPNGLWIVLYLACGLAGLIYVAVGHRRPLLVFWVAVMLTSLLRAGAYGANEGRQTPTGLALLIAYFSVPWLIVQWRESPR